MSHVSYTEFRQNMKAHLDAACDSRAPLVVTRQGGRSVVVIAEDEFNGMMETLHLLRSPRNAERLLASIAAADAGKFVTADLPDDLD
ncbi:type II toxin-antitoxin system prevent-host-death family antitoxin [Nitrospirillum sp. BR 11163]|uniref:type II toxin-antitoxin system Phd/YefM family antitoxin n=1 Tax=Nitrospirillum sp. BR 11163 TaxID=3104323 RepID=UPI002B003471|nr:type II toxin-antitoxin system prevent-host-death family antitoxin [Nitrospirillum sp. BR 11163]MEA1677140.1 type II toxin-antitoxin system prevent-host-death family antitoxin [Nitrospirillum sp. BR 11163]